MTVLSLLRDAGFEVYSRAQWGSPREADGSYARRAASSYYQLPKPLPFHFLHLTVTPDGDTIRQGKAGARQVETYGYTSPPMVSYQMLVTNEGRLFEGQNYGVKGTHTVNDKNISGYPKDLNRSGYAVALMQNVDDEVTDVQVVATAAAFAAAELAGWVERGAPILPHRMFAWKACPGDKAVARLEEITHLKNQLVAAKLPAGSINLGTIPEDDMQLNDKIKLGPDREVTVARALAMAVNQSTYGNGWAKKAAAAARTAASGVADLARLVGDATLTQDERTALAEDIAARTAAAVEAVVADLDQLTAAELADQLEITVKES